MANEKRLIDANAFEEKLKKFIGGTAIGFVLVGALRNEPTVDAVEVVRCKNCKHCTVTSDGMVCERALPTKRMMDYYIYGSTILAMVAADDFCSHGERKDND